LWASLLAFVAARWPAFRHRNFRLFVAGQMVSLLGTWMQSAAQLWLVYRLTGSAALLGAIGFATQIPVFVLAPLGGLVSDSYDRRRALLATQAALMVLAFTLAGLTLSGRVAPWHLFVIALGVGCVNAFDVPVRQAFLSQLVTRPELMNAVALNASMFHAARMAGPAIAGLLIHRVGEGWVFFVNGVSFVFVLSSLFAIRGTARPAPPEGSFRGRLVSGLRYVYGTPAVRALLLLLGLVSLTGMSYSVLLPLFANRVLHLGARGLGALMSAAGAGAVSAALRLAARSSTDGLRRLIPRAAVLAGIGLLGLALSHWMALSLVALFAVGFAFTTQLASTMTLLQVQVPDAMRGRVLSAYAMMFMGTAPFGQLLAGALADRLGAPATVALGGLCCWLGAAVFLYRAAEEAGDDAGLRAETAAANER
jgi:MFS family permease